ncbi:MAG: hypothetical protein ABIZ72_06410, partial [Candidatus Limnocylindrales bacterium]
MATLDALRAAVLPGAHWLAAGPDVAPSTAATLDLAWVRLMRAGLPAFDALEPADLAIMPWAALELVGSDGDEQALAALVRDCLDARIGGVVLVADRGAQPAAPGRPDLSGLVATAAAAGLPVLDAGPGDPGAIERSAIGFLVNHRAELERQATLLETRLEQVALGGGGPEGLAAAIAGFLGRPIAIEGRGGTTLAIHVPPDLPEAAAAVAAYHLGRRSAATRIALPIPGDPGATSGALALLGERPPTELERVATARIAGLVALELARDEALGRAVEIARHEPLPADGPPWVVILARQAPAGRDGAGADDDRRPPVRAPGRSEPAVVETEQREAVRRETLRREALRREVRSLAPARRLSLRGDVQSVEIRIVAAI